MNPREQRQRHTVVKQLAGDVETVLEGFADASNKAMNVLARDCRAYTDERVTASESATRQISVENMRIERAARIAFESRGIVDRFRWLILGK